MTRLRTAARLLLPPVTAALVVCAPLSASAQKASFVGVWKGNSICQIKVSACHDEGAVYTVKNGSLPGSFEFSGNKVVDGRETFMGTLECKLGSESDSLVCLQNNAKWTWKLQGDSMSGTLMYQGALYRKIVLARTK